MELHGVQVTGLHGCREPASVLRNPDDTTVILWHDMVGVHEVGLGFGYSTVFHPMCGTFTSPSSRWHVPGTSPRPSQRPSSSPTLASSCMPRQIPSSGVPAPTRSSSTSHMPLSRRLRAASRNAPTPGSTMPSAAATVRGSSVTDTPGTPAAAKPFSTLRRLPIR